MTRPSRFSSGDAYPSDLAQFLAERWNTPGASRRALPALETVGRFLSACYQASLMREEERPVTFRAIFASPAEFPEHGVPPIGFQPLKFCDALPLEAGELRRLSVAADSQRTLLGVDLADDGALRIWGLVAQGSRWLRNVQGGRHPGTALPSALVAHITAPGTLDAYAGDELVAKLRSGQLTTSRADPFRSTWLPAKFVDFRDELVARHLRARDASGTTWAPLERDLPREISERMMKRAIALLRARRHGGTIAFLPNERVCSDEPYVDLKYRFEPNAAQRTFPDLVVSLLGRLAMTHATATAPVGWREFETSADEELIALDEALFEHGHLIADLASTDGVVALNKHHDLLGFGGMISGRLPDVRTGWRARDLEAKDVIEEATDNVGSRHRSAYRLAAAAPGAVLIVVSQDGGVRFVAHQDGRVTYWEYD